MLKYETVEVAEGQRWRHLKRGTEYEVLGVAELQASRPQHENAALVVYRGADGKIWARNSAEFTDGRFALSDASRTAVSAPAGDGDAIEAAARAMCDRVNGIGDYDENIEQRRPGWTAQAKAALDAAALARRPAMVEPWNDPVQSKEDFLAAILARSPNGETVSVKYHPDGDWSVFDSLHAEMGEREALTDLCEAMEYWSGCDDGVTPDEASSNIMSAGGAWPALAYEKARSIIARPRPAAAEDFLTQLRRINTDRYRAWVGDAQDAGILFDAAELGGEVGELLNVVKKLEREDRGWRGSRAAPGDFADECADVLICLDKLARRKGVDLAAATVAKFNATSAKVDLPHRLALQFPPTKAEV
ncbi:MazG-like family protein [Sphingomonas sp. Leaf10]|uniref:MazG-like family protein n=1 Tax=Sphingomonas sp. Leaf10 TaxID=1735676 RepID=UPI0006F9AE62|nr:MazG-like family protein [Sphingomonas sp. Leaf10]KQM36051.1 hypothetical protein ASE59_15395 [Sphingomonas sp. Leaf10]